MNKLLPKFFGIKRTLSLLLLLILPGFMISLPLSFQFSLALVKLNTTFLYRATSIKFQVGLPNLFRKFTASRYLACAAPSSNFNLTTQASPSTKSSPRQALAKLFRQKNKSKTRRHKQFTKTGVKNINDSLKECL